MAKYPANLRLHRITKNLDRLKSELEEGIESSWSEQRLIQTARFIKHTEIEILIIRKNRLKYDYRANGGIKPIPSDFDEQLSHFDELRAQWEQLSDREVLAMLRDAEA